MYGLCSQLSQATICFSERACPVCLSLSQSRLPLFDNTLDIIHCVNSVKYLPMIEFEELLFEWDRVLRVGESLRHCVLVLF